MPGKHILLAGLLLFAGAAFAQDAPVLLNQVRGQVITLEPAAGADAFYLDMVPMNSEFVQNAPYTATATTQTTQVLADGNKIVRNETALLARDSQGRTRREQTVSKPGAAPGSEKKVVMIDDPVGKFDVVMNSDGQVARSQRREVFRLTEGDTRRKLEHVQIDKLDKEKLASEAGETTRETLPSQVIEGVTCEGIRETRTIPAGAIGNEKPIVIVSESWTSPELHLLMMRKRTDPRFGETLYKVSDLKRVEPDPALFQMPANTKFTDSSRF